MCTSYELPDNVYSDWQGCQAEWYQPSDRQKLVIAAVQTALDEKLYYSSDVLKAVSTRLGVTPEQALAGAKYVEGGHVGMDCYYARKYINAQRDLALERQHAQQLCPFVGLKLGVAIFGDLKRTTSVQVLKVDAQGRRLTLTGRRGRLQVTIDCSVTTLAHALDRAAESKARSDSFADFCHVGTRAALQRPTPLARVD